MKTLPTWGGKSAFNYSGSVTTGTETQYGRGFCSKASVSAKQYSALRTNFSKREVPIGTSRNPPTGSVEEWLMQNVTHTAIASYVGPILETLEAIRYALRSLWRTTPMAAANPVPITMRAEGSGIGNGLTLQVPGL